MTCLRATQASDKDKGRKKERGERREREKGAWTG